MAVIQLIVGLGNPGSKYDRTRHNAGFWLVDELAKRESENFRSESRFSGEISKIHLSGRPVWLLKPTTFMNRSGLAVHQMASFYKISVNHILVVHDELDLPPGTIRLKHSGGHGGHNGLRDIHAQMGKDYWRLRVGIGHPGDRNKVMDYVLSRPGKSDETEILSSIDRALEVIDMIAAGDTQKAMNQLHTSK